MIGEFPQIDKKWDYVLRPKPKHVQYSGDVKKR
jgi:hypothetical protein